MPIERRTKRRTQDFEEHGYWTVYSQPILDEEDYEYRPVINDDADCKTCIHGQMEYYHCQIGAFRDQFKSLLCKAGKVPVCRNGFIKAEEMRV